MTDKTQEESLNDLYQALAEIDPEELFKPLNDPEFIEQKEKDYKYLERLIDNSD